MTINRPLYIAPYEGESACDVTVVFDDAGHVYYADERPDDRDVDGILWERWDGAPLGPLQMALHHPARQREVMDGELLCGVCKGEPDRDDRGVLWLLNADADVRENLAFPADIVTATPAVCRTDARRALRACSVLQDGFIAVRAREAELVGVRGTVYSPTAPPLINQVVRFDDPDIHRVVARQLMRELCNAVLDEDTLPSSALAGRRGISGPTTAGGSAHSVWG
ncbi:hypothetical protein [Streptomyces prunicolor]|uniref:hypothetical protein n=1 Tax=Streptomyces prunicolor TaxID=67348 RepID=UPI0003811E7A|nr:hypothetical protein [Streptomyces prunicolor]